MEAGGCCRRNGIHPTNIGILPSILGFYKDFLGWRLLGHLLLQEEQLS
jgi:hypothetical protein